VFCVPEADGSYRIYARPPVTEAGGEDESPLDVTRRVAGAIEREIRENPGKWLWMYKRWKHVPPGAAREGYPFYSTPVPAGP
jgi:lauroyl/myristoyl acyltransferase